MDHNGGMSLTEMQVGEQTIRYEREATASIYGRKIAGALAAGI
jgi:hypothetical protein